MFYNKVIKLCAKKGISITKLTNLLGLSSSVITGWKNGAEPRMSTVKSIADFFRVPPDSLLDTDDSMLSPTIAYADAESASDIPDGYEQLTEADKREINEIIAVYIKRRSLLSQDA